MAAEELPDPFAGQGVTTPTKLTFGVAAENRSTDGAVISS
jgi:hypothetical protein